jgi:hypothetical protein
MIDYLKVNFSDYTPAYPVQELLDYVVKHGTFDKEGDFSCYVQDQYIVCLSWRTYSLSIISKNKLRDIFGFASTEVYWLDKNLNKQIKRRISEIGNANREKLGEWLKNQK